MNCSRDFLIYDNHKKDTSHSSEFDMTYIKEYIKNDNNNTGKIQLALPSNAIHVSTVNNTGIDELIDSILSPRLL